ALDGGDKGFQLLGALAEAGLRAPALTHSGLVLVRLFDSGDLGLRVRSRCQQPFVAMREQLGPRLNALLVRIRVLAALCVALTEQVGVTLMLVRVRAPA